MGQRCGTPSLRGIALIVIVCALLTAAVMAHPPSVAAGAAVTRPVAVSASRGRAEHNGGTATILARPASGLQRATAGQSLYYDDGREIFVVDTDGSGRAALALLPPGTDFIPQVADGRLLYDDGNYWLATPQGQRIAVTPPSLGPGEVVFSARMSSDGQRIAWQLYSPMAYAQFTTNLGVSRIVVTDQFGGRPQTVMQQRGGDTYGDVTELFGWRTGAPTVFTQDISDTLLVQTRLAAVADGTELRGLQELDPTIGDLVNDFLPPTTTDLPVAQALSISPDSRLVTYASAESTLPSGEGPLPTAIAVVDLTTGRSETLDDRSHYPGAPDSTHHLTRYPYFSLRAGAPISPNDLHVLYTLVTVTYPNGSTTPHLAETALMASLLSHSTVVLADGARAVGWLDDATAIVRKSDGLYAVDITTKAQRLIVSGQNLQYLGLRD